VNKKYLDADKPSPTSHPVVRSTLKGLARLRGSSTRKVEALREYHIQAMLQAAPNTPIGKRDAAIIAVGFAGALRRSEICNLNVEDIEFLDLSDDCEDRMILTIRQSKTDQQGKGQRVPILDGNAIRPIHRLRQWLGSSGIATGPLFQTMKRGGHLRGKPMHHSDIPRIVKHYAELVGLNPKDIAGHSLRAGFVTSAAVHHARLDKIMAVTRHTNPATVMGYIRDADAFTDHAGRHFL
jgi:integrase